MACPGKGRRSDCQGKGACTLGWGAGVVGSSSAPRPVWGLCSVGGLAWRAVGPQWRIGSCLNAPLEWEASREDAASMLWLAGSGVRPALSHMGLGCLCRARPCTMGLQAVCACLLALAGRWCSRTNTAQRERRCALWSGRGRGARGHPGVGGLPCSLWLMLLVVFMLSWPAAASAPGAAAAPVPPPRPAGTACVPPAHTAKIMSVNCNNLGTHWATISEMQWDVLLCQEARMDQSGFVRKDARRRGWQVFTSTPDAGGRVLLCSIFRTGAASLCHELGDNPRAITVRWYGGGGASWRITNMYGAVDESDGATQQTASLAREAAAAAEARPGIPCLVCGDFNRTLEELPCRYAFACSGWRDLGTGPTCDMAAVPKRIDLLLANEAAQRRVRAVDNYWDENWRPHSTQLVEISVGPLPREPLWDPPSSLAEPPTEGSPDPASAWARLSRERGAFRRALDNDTLDAAWRGFEKLALGYHSQRVGEAQHRSPGRLRWGVAEAAAKYAEDPWMLASRAAQAALRRAYNVRSRSSRAWSRTRDRHSGGRGLGKIPRGG